MAITAEQFKDALRHFGAGVTIVTATSGGRSHGMTVSAFSSVSAEPPLIAVVINRQHTITRLLEAPDAVFAVNVLALDQADLSNRFAFEKDEDRFLRGQWASAVTGAPILADALVWMDCTVYERVPAGTHVLYLGEVQASRVCRPEEMPLIYWNRSYRLLASLGEPPSR